MKIQVVFFREKDVLEEGYWLGGDVCVCTDCTTQSTPSQALLRPRTATEEEEDLTVLVVRRIAVSCQCDMNGQRVAVKIRIQT